ncbi:helix-turn-helix transcriptional regulator [Amycolatopsis solani]|uniref:helix-turn-helix transcriptional regulator n=2 Tax=Amycolatopsis solani TaxID=3028615 RepID=UPI0029700B25|nr:LuxR C-terminal-related transcriptional regulator [Amycolatopsis sp. MEP2-6]
METLERYLAFDADFGHLTVMVKGAPAAGQSVVHLGFGRLAEAHGALVLGTVTGYGDGVRDVLDALLHSLSGAALSGEQAARVKEFRPPAGPAAGRAVGGLLADLAGARPIVLLIDDFQFVDVETAEMLAYLRRGTGKAQLLLVTTEACCAEVNGPHASWELIRYPHVSLSLSPLSEREVAAELERGCGREAAARCATTVHELSGGNPVLVNALVEAVRSTGSAEDPACHEYGAAVLAILDGVDPATAAVARAIAVLDADAGSAVLARFARLSPEVTGRALECLDRAGITRAGRFRHGAARAALLESMTAADRADAHVRAAELLHAGRVGAEAVAGHLAAADRVPGPWALTELLDAAENEIEWGDAGSASRYLALAHRYADAGLRARVTHALARAGWRAGPARAAEHVRALRAAADGGTLDGPGARTLIRYALWDADGETAAAALRVLTAAGLDAGERAELRTAWMWWYGAVPRAVPGVADDPWGRAVEALETLWSGDAKAASAAETLLRNTKLGDSSLELVATAVTALTIAGETGQAAEWCDRFLETAAERGAVTWQALLSVFRARVTFHRGEPVRAAAQAEAALAALDPRDWGATIAVPVETAIGINTAIGRNLHAAEALEVPVPDAVFTTVPGLRYLCARGRHHLAEGRLLTATSEFARCERLAVELELDRPALVPWRTGMAEARLRLGDTDVARRLLLDQLDRIDAADRRTRGSTLLVLARVSRAAERAQMLDTAAACLGDVGGPGELADLVSAFTDAHGEDRGWERLRSLTDPAAFDTLVTVVCRLLQARGDFTRARTASARASGAADDRAGRAVRPAPPGRLSDAERRVAELAAGGHSNREIGRRLHVTVSTVEQHLTNVYRKLGVDGRAHLPSGLAGRDGGERR